MNKYHLIDLSIRFYKSHYEAIFILAILSQFGIVKFMWECIKFVGSIIFLGYAYFVVGIRKLKFVKKNNLINNSISQ